MSINYTKNRAKVKELLLKIDSEFSPPISVQEGSLDLYLDGLLADGKIIIEESDSSIGAMLGYTHKGGMVTINILWIAKEKRKTRFLYNLFMYAFQNESSFEGKITAKTNEDNADMRKVLEKLGFEITKKIEEHMTPERTSLIYEANFSDVKNYLSIDG